MAIQQKLHARLVQKLILTPSLQQAIKLLPMSTLELAELLNQEMVENPMLEEVPSEDPQLADQTQTPEAEAAKTKDEGNDTWDDADSVFLRGVPRRRLSAARAARGQGAPPDREHAVEQQLALGSPLLAALAADRRPCDARHRRSRHRQPR